MSDPDQQLPDSASGEDNGLIEAGEIREVEGELPVSGDGEINIPTPPPPKQPPNAGSIFGVFEKNPFEYYQNKIHIHQSWTAILLAFLLVAVLVFSTMMHYQTVEHLYLTDKVEAAKELETIFDKWFPVITGFTGSAITYFLTRNRS